MRRKIVSLILFLNVVAVCYPAPAHAQFWGTTNIFGSFAVNLMQTIQRQIEGALLGTLKMAVIKMLNSKVGQLVGGVSGGAPLFITDYKEFLYQTPVQNANLYMNDFLSMSTRGKGSSANYESAGSSSNKSIANNYIGMLQKSAKNATTERVDIPTYDLEEYASSPDELFATGNFRGFNALISNPANNTFGYTMAAQSAYQNKIEMEKQVAIIKATASGFLPSEQNGSVVAPAGAIEAAITNVQDLGNKMIAAASNPGEILSGAVSAMANKLVSNMIQKGVGKIQEKISKTIDSVDNKMMGQINSATNQFGPAAQYMGNINQGANGSMINGANGSMINSNTPPPPPATTAVTKESMTCSSIDGSCTARSLGCSSLGSAWKAEPDYSCDSSHICCID